ncbi:MAG: MBL fold metallo-hydrolase [Nitrospirota bacterium]
MIDLGLEKINPDDDMKRVIKEVFDGLGDEKSRYLKSIRKNQKMLNRFISPGNRINENTPSFISILRKWNSYTPVLPANMGHSKGGGYFIYHAGVGIVIDPGFNFIQNFFRQGFKIDDIDVIIITHAHNDHTAELESILSLYFKRNKNVKKKEKKKIDIYLNVGAFKKYSSFFDLSTPDKPDYIGNIVPLDSYNEYLVPKNDNSDGNSDISIITNKTQHHEMITATYALGFILRIGDKYIRFTGDTGWDSDVETQNNKYFEEKQIEKIDILIPHIGSIEKTEFQFDFTKTIKENKGNFYKNHLGILGCICLAYQIKPEMIILSEFGEELRDIRIDIVRKIHDILRIPSLPGDIGLHIKIDDLTVFCCRNGNFVSLDKIKPYKIHDDIYYSSDGPFKEYDNNFPKKLFDIIERKK